MKNKLYLLTLCLLTLTHSKGFAETGTVSANLDIHVPSLNYESLLGTQNIWADFEYLGTNPQGKHIWGLKNYGANPNNVPQPPETVKWLGKTMLESSGWKAKINIGCLDKDKDCGTIDFQSLNCAGKLTYTGQKYERYVFAEKLEYGSCVKGCEIHIESNGASYKEFCGEQFTGAGKLTY
ncbi:MAG: hypothetical protein HOP02_09820 [Methylococcaceae bacterium]|nr:hypothetical protein [Methylococcaceae bacterium]